MGGAALPAITDSGSGNQGMVTENEGIVADDVDRSIANLGEVACQGMVQTDGQTLQITLNNKLVVGHSTLD
jgi:L-cysteine desulfidase